MATVKRANLNPNPPAKRGKYRLYDSKALDAAAEEVRQKTLSIRAAAEKYGVPKSSLNDYLTKLALVEMEVEKKGRALSDVDVNRLALKRGNAVLLDVEEEQLVALIERSNHAGMCLTPDQLFYYVMKILEKFPRDHPSVAVWQRDGRPSRKLFANFMRRYPHLTKRVSDPLEHARRDITREQLDEYFRVLATAMQEVFGDGPVDPSRIWNLDETGLQLDRVKKHVLAIKGTKKTYTLGNSCKESVTVLMTICADGSHIPPMFICKGKEDLELPSAWAKVDFEDTSLEEAVMYKQESAYMTNEGFLHFFKERFLPFTAQDRKKGKVLLIMDNFGAHVQLAVLPLAYENNVVLVSFPPHATHILQPLDVVIMQAFKKWLSKAVQLWRLHGNNSLRVLNWVAAMEVISRPWGTMKQSAWDATHKPTRIMKAFEETGIYPFNPSAANVKLHYDKAPSRTAAIATAVAAEATGAATGAAAGTAAGAAAGAAAAGAAAGGAAAQQENMDPAMAVHLAGLRSILQAPCDQTEARVRKLLRKEPGNAVLLTSQEHRDKLIKAAMEKEAEVARKEQARVEREAQRAQKAGAQQVKQQMVIAEKAMQQLGTEVSHKVRQAFVRNLSLVPRVSTDAQRDARRIRMQKLREKRAR
jgi:hypothetical protein